VAGADCLALRRMKITPKTIRARRTIPPTTPPAMAPTLDLWVVAPPPMGALVPDPLGALLVPDAVTLIAGGLVDSMPRVSD